MSLSLLYRYANGECPVEHPLDLSVEMLQLEDAMSLPRLHLHRISNLRRKFHIKGTPPLRSCFP